VVVGVVASVGSALLVLASGALLGTIALLWASVRTLSGDAPLPLELEALAARRHVVDDLSEQKTRVLRALKDLESEHALGKIDDADYGAFVTQFRDEAKTVMRQMDLEVAPLREEAEKIAQEYLASHRKMAVTHDERTGPVARQACQSCGVSNEPDAAFCKKCGSALKTAEKVDATN
jgi:rRNA maturation endonuclease Nob1